MLSKEDLARESSVVISANDEQPRLLDIPRDTSGPDQPFFKLPLPDEGVEEEDYDDVVVVAVGDDDEEQVKLINSTEYTKVSPPSTSLTTNFTTVEKILGFYTPKIRVF